MSDLLSKKCIPCEGGTFPLSQEKIEGYLQELSGWKAKSNKNLSKEFSFLNFKTALVFVNQIGEVAEREGHHPDIALSWGKVGVTLSTHAIGGLSENDFILAAKIDAIKQ